MAALSTYSNKLQPVSNSTGDPLADADGLLGLARGIEDQIDSEISLSPVEEEYSAAMVETVEEKQDQASQIEDRLENLIETQSSRLQQVQSHQPGMLSLPGTRAKWQNQVAQAQATIQRLQNRLETVREIKDGITANGSKIEAIAAAKLEYREPKLADEFAELQEAHRLHELHMRQQQEKKHEERRVQAQDAPLGGQALSRGISQTRGSGAS